VRPGREEEIGKPGSKSDHVPLYRAARRIARHDPVVKTSRRQACEMKVGVEDASLPQEIVS
jgi:hypothetical protein